MRYATFACAGLLLLLALSSVGTFPAGSGDGPEDGARNPAPSTPEERDVTDPGTRGPDEWTRFRGSETNNGLSEATAPWTDDILWEFATGQEVHSSPVVADGRVYIASWDKNLYCLDLETGSELWCHPLGDKMYSSPTVADGMVYIGTGTEVTHVSTGVVAVDADTGEEVWAMETPGSVFSSPVVRGGLLYFGDEAGHFYAVDAGGDGAGGTTVEWTIDTGFQVWSTAAFKGNEVLFTGGECRFYAADATTGAIRLNVSTPVGLDGILASPVVEGKKVMVGSAAPPEGKLLCLDLDDGSELWNISTNAAQYGVCSTPAVADGTVYCGSNNGLMYALDLDDGTERWTFATGNTVDGIYPSPAVADGLVFFGSADSVIYAADADDGTEAWKYATGPATYGVSSSPAVVTGKMLIGTGDGRLICFGEPAPRSFELTVEVIDPVTGDAQYSVRATVLEAGSPLPGVAVRLSAPGLTFAANTGVSGPDGTFTSTLTPDADVMGTTVRIQAQASMDGYPDRSAFIDMALPAGPDLPMEVAVSPDSATIAPGEKVTLNVTVTSDGTPAEGVRVLFSASDHAGPAVLSAPHGQTSADGLTSVTLTVPATHPGGTIRVNFTGTRDGYVNGSALANITVTGPGEGDGGTDGTDGGDGYDGDDGDGDGDDASDAGTVDVGGSSVPLAGLIGMMVLIVGIVVVLLAAVIARKGRESEGDDDEETDGRGRV